MLSLFEYRLDTTDVQYTTSFRKDGVPVTDLTYASPMGGRVPAYLVTPDRQGRFPAVIFLHPGAGNRDAFLQDAITLANRGIVSLLIDAPFVRPEPWRRAFGQYLNPKAEQQIYVQSVIDLRAGIDLLTGHSSVDATRIGFAGRSFGGTIGGMLAGVENRINCYVIAVGFPSLTYFWDQGTHPIPRRVRSELTHEQFGRFLEALKPLDPIQYLVRNTTAPTLFQFARKDEFVPVSEALRYYEAARSPKELRWYDSDHQLTPGASSECVEWLCSHLLQSR